jgi:nucleotide-binding universal stress UspA family protein
MVEYPEYKKVLFCTDFSENADYAFNFACGIARRDKGLLYILHVIPPDPYLMYSYMSRENMEKIDRNMAEYLEDNYTNRYVKNLKDEVRFKIITKTGREDDEILTFAEQQHVDVIVMGTHGRTGIEHVFFGSVAEKVLRHSPFPVFVIPCKKKRERP